jgi:hypothetical protein
MTNVKPLFMMGNKRSGTSLLVTLLNLHPDVFITHETDSVWILYQARNVRPSQYRCYPWDGPLGMNATLQTCHHMLQSYLYGASEEGAIAETFFRVQEHLMRCGSAIQRPYQKNSLAWVGDKKPVQHADPELRSFLRTHFPNARYIHIVRDPRAVVASMIEAAKQWKQGVPQYWKTTPQHILERWAIHEEWVLQAKSLETSPIHTLRLEDLCKEPVQTMAELFDFLEVETPPGITEPIRELTNPIPNRKYESFSLPILPRAARIMQCYSYHGGQSTTPLLNLEFQTRSFLRRNLPRPVRTFLKTVLLDRIQGQS